MSGSELDVLICEGRTLAAHVCDSNVQLERMLRRAHRIAERVRVMREHQRSLDEIFAETSDGIRRRQLLDELQKENRDRMRCIEENSILRENLSEGFMAFEQIFLRNRKMEERMATDGKIRSQINAYSMSVPDEAEEWRRGQEEANVREALRKFVLRAEQVMRDGEAESSSLAEFAAQVHVHNLGIKDLLSVHQRMHFSKLYRSGLDMLRCELNEQQEIVGSANSADLVDDSEHVNREITTVFNKKLFDLAPTTTDADGESEDEDGSLNGTVIEVPLEDD